MNSMDSNTSRPGFHFQFNPSVSSKGEFILGYLISFGEVGIEVVLSRELAVGRNSTVSGQGHLHSEFDHVSIQNREYTRHAQAHRTDMGIRAAAEPGGAATENLALGQELSMYFQSYYRFKAHPTLSSHGASHDSTGESRLETLVLFIKTMPHIALPACFCKACDFERGEAFRTFG